MANELFKLMGEIGVNSQDALNAIDKVLKAAQGLYNYINNNSGTINVTTGNSTTVIDQVLQDAKKLYNHINNNTGKINAENSTALSRISAVSSAATDVYNLINTKTGTVNIDTSGATQKIAALQESAQAVTGYLGTGSSTTGSTGTGGIAGSIGKISLLGFNWSNGWLSKVAEAGKKTLKVADTAMGALAAVGVYKGIGEMTDFFQAGYEYNTFKETGVAKLQTLLQTTPEDAKSFFGELEQFAIDSPLTMEGVLESAIKMLSMDIERGNIVPTMQMLGDLALGDSYTMQRTAKALSDALANETLLAQEGRQYTEAGVPIWRLLSEYYATQEGHPYYGRSAGALRSQNKKEEPISAEDMLAALQMATSPDGMFYDAINVMMGTTAGQAEKMQDNYRRTAGMVTGTFVDVFTNETIPALNGILDKLNNWAMENPEDLEKLASAFSTLATDGIGGLLDALMKLVGFYDENSSKLNMLAGFIGTLLLFGGYPKLGLGMIAMSQVGQQVNVKDAMETDIESGEEHTVASDLLSDESLAILADGGSKEDLPADQLDKYDFAHYLYTLDERFKGLFGDDYHSDGFLTQLFNGIFFPDEEGSMDRGGGKRWGEEADKPSLIDQILNWLIPSAGAEEGYYGGAAWNPSLGGLWRDPRFDLDNPGGANTLQGMFADLPARIEDAAKAGSAAGVAEGVSKISVNGTVTTGQVVLDSGAVVGELTPKINMALGDFYAVSYNDD